MNKLSRRILDWSADNIFWMLIAMILVIGLVANGDQNADGRKALIRVDFALGFGDHKCPNEAQGGEDARLGEHTKH